jgi:hypothetical protein
MTRLAALALIPCFVATPLAAAQTPAPPAPVAAIAPIAADPMAAHETRQQVHEILRSLPPAVGEVLRHDPSLLTRADYIAPYPALAGYLQRHPEVPLNPSYFIGTPESADTDPNGRAMRMAESVMDGIGVFVIIGAVLSFLAWLVRTAVDHRRWLRLSKIQVDVHTKVLDRLSSHDDLLAYMQSPSGRRFLDSAPIERDGQVRPTAAALTRVLWSLQAGVVLSAVGVGFWFVGRNVLAEAAQGFAIISTLALALGVGFIVSAAVSYVISTRHGLIGAEPRAQHE